MKEILDKLGRKRAVFILTIFVTLLTVILDIGFAHFFHHKSYDLSESIVRIIMIPVLITPVTAWYLLGTFFELNDLQKETELLATYDHLTGLLNRRAFLQLGERLHQVALRNKQKYCLLAIDIDYFKKINDEYGHGGGDAVLASFGEVAMNISRNSDLVGRLGGEEFIFLLPNTTMEQAEELAQRLSKSIEETVVEYQGKQISYTFSAGMAMNEYDEGLTLDEVLKNVDVALYTAKEQGRNCIVNFSEDTMLAN